ncbi:hypothetical protein, partial [Pseudomonas sp. RIT-PI-o]|uniref:hypothetical protein n=1 Tax=Pseudomonas sp. RIT-PI-o TaxID=1690246 RepID=UPI001F22A472
PHGAGRETGRKYLAESTFRKQEASCLWKALSGEVSLSGARSDSSSNQADFRMLRQKFLLHGPIFDVTKINLVLAHGVSNVFWHWDTAIVVKEKLA